MMFKVVCDKCGKETVLRHLDLGLENPEGWDLEKQYLPLKREWEYRTFCPDCNPKFARKVEEEK